MTFKKLLSSAALAAVTLAAFPAAAQTWSSLIDTDTSRDYGSNDMSTVLYYGLTHKFVDGNTFTAETRNDVEYRSGRKNDTKLKHSYLRFIYSMNDIATLGDGHKFTMAFRFRAPTDNDFQKRGTIGQLLFRPTLKGKLGPVEYMLRESFGPYLQRQRAMRYQKAGSPGVAPANPLFTTYQEVSLSIPLGLEGLAFNTLWTHLNTYYGKANNQNPYWTGFFEQDYEIRMGFASLGGLEVALATTNGTFYNKNDTGAKPQDPSNDLWFNEGSTYALRVTKGF